MTKANDIPDEPFESHAHSVENYFKSLNPVQSIVKRLLTPPIFSGDEDKTRLSHSLYLCLLLSLFVVITVILVDFILSPFQFIHYLIFMTVVLVILIGLILVRKGFVKPVGILFPFLIWLFSTLLLAQSGGVYTASFGSAYVIVIVFAGILFGFKAALGYAFLCILGGIGLGYGASSEILPTKPSFSPWLPVFVQSAIFLILAPLLGLTTTSISNSLKQAKQELEARKKYAEALRENEEVYHSLFTNNLYGVFLADPSGQILEVNPAACQILGYTEEEIKALGRLGTFDQNDLRLPDYIAKQRLSPTIRAEINFVGKDGVKIPCELARSRYTDKNGKERSCVVFSDITKRKEYEEALAAEKERLSVTLRAIEDGVITTDIEGRVMLINRAAEELTGWNQREALGLNLDQVFQVIDSKTREPLSNSITALLQDKQSIEHAEPVLLVKNGKNDECYITYNIAPIYTNQNEDVIWRVLTFLNVTEKYKLEEERRKAKNLESLGLLAGGIAHDFNNILTVILTNLSLAKLSQEWESGLTELLDEAENATVRAKELTYQLLTFAKGGAPIRKLAQLKDIIQDTVNFVLQGTNVRSEFDLSADLWPVEIDQVQISQVLQNLVLNSLQAMPQGGVVRIEACNDEIREQKKVLLPPGKYLRISVKDQGTGIKPEDLPNIFDPYFTTKEKGKGLGLSISYSIIKRHEGHIVVESEFGKGTTAYIYLPVTC